MTDSSESESSSDDEPSIDLALLFPNIIPITQSDPSTNVAGIAYSQDYSKAMSLLRALQASPMHHPNALTLTSYIIHINPAHYSVWACRRAWIGEEEWEGEWAFTERLLKKHPKSYQVCFVCGNTRRSGTTDSFWCRGQKIHRVSLCFSHRCWQTTRRITMRGHIESG
jgi:hypothetical protein